MLQEIDAIQACAGMGEQRPPSLRKHISFANSQQRFASLATAHQRVPSLRKGHQRRPSLRKHMYVLHFGARDGDSRTTLSIQTSIMTTWWSAACPFGDCSKGAFLFGCFRFFGSFVCVGFIFLKPKSKMKCRWGDHPWQSPNEGPMRPDGQEPLH